MKGVDCEFLYISFGAFVSIVPWILCIDGVVRLYYYLPIFIPLNKTNISWFQFKCSNLKTQK
jgi:hypothetical protein